jgi:hypothetical protein
MAFYILRKDGEMIKKIPQIVLLSIGLLFYQIGLAGTGLLFNVTSSGTDLTILTIKPHHQYPSAGIKLKSSNYHITSGCQFKNNGYCTFAVSDTTPATIGISGAAGTLQAVLCLDGVGGVSCQNYNDIPYQPVLNARNAYIANNGAAGGVGDPAISLCQIAKLQSIDDVSRCRWWLDTR